MPLFDFVCRTCGRRFEALIQSESAVACPECSSTRLERQLPSFAVLSRSPKARCGANTDCAACCEGAGAGRCPLN